MDDRVTDAMKRASEAVNEAMETACFFGSSRVEAFHARAGLLAELMDSVVELADGLDLGIGFMSPADCVSDDELSPELHLFNARTSLALVLREVTVVHRRLDATRQSLAHLSDR